VLLPVDELPTDALLLGQLRALGDLCQRQDGKTFAIVGGHVGCNARGFYHLLLTYGQREQVSQMGAGSIKRRYWLAAIWVSLKSVTHWF